MLNLYKKSRFTYLPASFTLITSASLAKVRLQSVQLFNKRRPLDNFVERLNNAQSTFKDIEDARGHFSIALYNSVIIKHPQ